MGKVIGPPLSPDDIKWMQCQHIFFHATSPLNSLHKINLSPKSAEQFRVVSENTVCWLDFSGSGAETAAHLLENGRITTMFVALNGPPKIIRLYGKGVYYSSKRHLP